MGRSNCIIGDPPGVGKSAQGIGVSNVLDAGRTLIVCPASLRLNWQREVWLWSVIPNVSTYPVLTARDGINAESDYVIISYDLLRNDNLMAAILDNLWDHVILDEAHFLKDPKGNKRTKMICAPDMLPSVTGRFSLLTGTLTPNQPIECYNAIRLCNWDAIDRCSLEEFRETYYEAGGGMVRAPHRFFDQKTNQWVTKSELHWSDKVRNKPRNLEDLQYRLRKHLMVRRTKEAVLPQLPQKQWHPFPLQMTGEIRAALRHPGWVRAEKLYDMDQDAFNTGVPIDGEVATARRMLGEAKAPAVLEYIHQLMAEGVEKLVVCAWHKTVLDLLRHGLERYGLAYMDGGTTNARRQSEVDRFQNDESVGIMLGQQTVLGLGWTLTAAQNAVAAEYDWVPGVNDQFLDRLHRIGQKGGYVLGHLPVVPGTLDERILGSAIEKDGHIYKTLDAE